MVNEDDATAYFHIDVFHVIASLERFHCVYIHVYNSLKMWLMYTYFLPCCYV